LSVYKQHLDLANERYKTAQEQFEDEKYHTGAHLFINAAINYHNAICQKYLKQIPRHKQHSDTSYFEGLRETLGPDFQKYRDAYEFLMSNKSEADYGRELSLNTAKQIQRRARIIKEIAEHLL